MRLVFLFSVCFSKLFAGVWAEVHFIYKIMLVELYIEQLFCHFTSEISFMMILCLLFIRFIVHLLCYFKISMMLTVLV